MIRKKHELKVEGDLRSDKDVDRLDGKKEARTEGGRRFKK